MQAAQSYYSCSLEKIRALGIPTRCSRFGIGKRMGNAVWLHQNYANLISGECSFLHSALDQIAEHYRWTLIKWDSCSQNLSFIDYPDFDLAFEPATGTSLVYKHGVGWRSIKAPCDPWILHHKFLTVGDDYQGFDIEHSIKRSLEWKEKFGKDCAVSSRIGKQSFWLEECKKRNVVVDTI